MTYEEFKNKWLGKGVDYDGSYGNQCMDVYRMYVKEVLNKPQSPPVQGAKDVWNTYLPEVFDRISNTPDGVPKKGDVVIWGMNPYGHIAICDNATKTSFNSFEQNWTELDGSGVTEIRNHNYNNVLGWLTPKSVTISGMTDDQKRALSILEQFKVDNNHGNLEGAISAATNAARDLANKNKEIEVLKKLSDTLASQVTDLTAKVTQKQEELDSCYSDYQTANKQIDKLNKQIVELTQQLEAMTASKNQYKNWYETKCDEVKALDKMTAWQHIRYGIKLLSVKK